MNTLEQLVSAAREFSHWCDAPPADEAAEAREALRLLSRLYACALAVESPDEFDTELDGPALERDEWQRVFERAGALPFNYYSEVAEPTCVPADEAVVGDLADDVADIYRDLFTALALYDAKHAAEAQWEFVHSFRSHWGRHAVAAMHALHCWLVASERLP